MGIRRELGVRAGRKLSTTTMPSDGDPTDFISTMDDLRLRLADMGEQILDATYADLLLISSGRCITENDHSCWSKSS